VLRPADALSASVDSYARRNVIGAHRIGPIYAGRALEQNGHHDWFVTLEAGRCYTFVGRGEEGKNGDGIRKLSLYLWGPPSGRRLTDRRASEPVSVMPYCVSITGPYHFQVKAGEGKGEYRVGIYRSKG
jgi:hypothetical protein